MNDAITMELEFFLVSILWGIVLLLAYDHLRILRRIISHNSFCIAIEDIIFWAITSVFVFAMLYHMNYGIIRAFSIMGIGLGMLLYSFLLSDLYVTWISKLILLLLKPLRLLADRIKKMLRFIAGKMKKVYRYVYKRLKKIAVSVKMKLNRYGQKIQQKHTKMKENARTKRKARMKENEGKKKHIGKKKHKQGIEDERIESPPVYRRIQPHRSGSIPRRNHKSG